PPVSRPTAPQPRFPPTGYRRAPCGRLPEMLDRIEEIRAEAAAAIEAAGGTDALDELRGRYLRRKAELPSILRGIANLPEEERGPVGSGANRARQALEALLE